MNVKPEKTAEKLNELFGVAENIIDEIEDTEQLITTKDTLPTESSNLDVDISDESLYTLNELKEDFISAKDTLKKIIKIGEALMEDIIIDFHSLTASQVDALSNLSKTISQQVKIMLELYKDLKSFETEQILTNDSQNVTIEQQNVIQVTTADAISEFLKKKKSEQEIKEV